MGETYNMSYDPQSREPRPRGYQGGGGLDYGIIRAQDPNCITHSLGATRFDPTAELAEPEDD